MKKAEIKAAVAERFPNLRIKISIIGGKTYIGVVSAPVPLIHGYHNDSIVFLDNRQIVGGELWNNGFQFTYTGQMVFSFLKNLVPDAKLSLGFPTRTGFEKFTLSRI